MHKIHRFFLAAFAATFFLLGSQASMASKPSIGFVLVGPHNDGGWSMRHYQGFKSLEKHGYESEYAEMVPEADSERVFRKLARKHDVVFGTSFGYMDPMVAAASKDKSNTKIGRAHV